MHRIIHLPHTDGIRVRMEADTFQGLFTAGVEVISEILAGKPCTGETGLKEWHGLVTRAADPTSLLVEFLSAVVTLSRTERVVFCHLEIRHFRNNGVRAVLVGKKVSSFAEDIKAVTYQEAGVKRVGERKWMTILVFDV